MAEEAAEEQRRNSPTAAGAGEDTGSGGDGFTRDDQGEPITPKQKTEKKKTYPKSKTARRGRMVCSVGDGGGGSQEAETGEGEEQTGTPAAQSPGGSPDE